MIHVKADPSKRALPKHLLEHLSELSTRRSRKDMWPDAPTETDSTRFSVVSFPCALASRVYDGSIGTLSYPLTAFFVLSSDWLGDGPHVRTAAAAAATTNSEPLFCSGSRSEVLRSLSVRSIPLCGWSSNFHCRRVSELCVCTKCIDG